MSQKGKDIELYEESKHAKTQMLEAEKVSIAVNEFLANHYVTYPEILEVIKNVWDNEDLSRTYVEEVIPGLMYKPPYEHEGFKDTLNAITVIEYQKMRKHGGNLSTIGFSQFGSQAKRQPRSLAVDELFTIGMLPGACGVITGVPGSGKTDMAVSEIYRTSVKKPNHQVIDNIKIMKRAKNSFYCAKLSDSLEKMLKHSLVGVLECKKKRKKNKKYQIKPHPTIWILDEAQVSRSRTRSTSNIALAQQQVTLLLRKLGGFQWLIYQQDNPPLEVRDFATHRLNKPSRKNKDYADFKIDSPDMQTGQLKLAGIRGWEQRRDDFEKNPVEKHAFYEFDTHAISSMSIDIWPVNLFNYATAKGELELEEYYEALLEFIAMHKGEMDKGMLLTEDVEVEMAMMIYDRCKKSLDPFDNKVASWTFLAHILGWETEDRNLEASAKALKRAVDKRRMKPMPIDIDD